MFRIVAEELLRLFTSFIMMSDYILLKDQQQIAKAEFYNIVVSYISDY